MNEDKIPNNAADSLEASAEPLPVEEVARILGVEDQLPPDAKVERPSKRGWQVRGPDTQPFPGGRELSELTMEKSMETARTGADALERQIGRFLPARPIVHYHVIVVERPRRAVVGKLAASTLTNLADGLLKLAGVVQRVANKFSPPTRTTTR